MQVNQSIHRAALYSAACDRENRHEHYTDKKNEKTGHKVCKLNYFDLALSLRIIRIGNSMICSDIWHKYRK